MRIHRKLHLKAQDAPRLACRSIRLNLIWSLFSGRLIIHRRIREVGACALSFFVFCAFFFSFFGLKYGSKSILHPPHLHLPLPLLIPLHFSLPVCLQRARQTHAGGIDQCLQKTRSFPAPPLRDLCLSPPHCLLLLSPPLPFFSP